DRLCRSRIVGDHDWIAIDVARRPLPVLAFPLIHVHPHGMPIGAREFRVDVDERLDTISAGRNVTQTPNRMTERGSIDDRGPARREILDIDAEQRIAGLSGAHD